MRARFSLQMIFALVLCITASNAADGKSSDPVSLCLKGWEINPRPDWQTLADACTAALLEDQAKQKNRFKLTLHQGLAIRRLKDLPRSVEIFSAALEHAGNDKQQAAALTERGRSFDMQGDFKTALEDLNAAIKLNPISFRAFYQRGLIKNHMGNAAAGRSDLEEALRLNPKYLRAKNSIGASYAREGAHEQAIDIYNDVIKQRPSLMWTYFWRGQSYAALGREQDAFSDFSKILGKQPKHQGAYIERAKVLLRLGRYNEADQDLIKADQLRTLSVEQKLLQTRGKFYAKEWAAVRDMSEALFDARMKISSRARIWHYLASRLEGRNHDRSADVLRPLRRENNWPGPIGRMLLNDITVKDLEAWLHDQPAKPEQRQLRLIEANLYEGYRLLSEGNLRQARYFLEQASEKSPPASLAHEAAKAALRDMVDG